MGEVGQGTDHDATDESWPLVSVVIPTHDAERTIGEQLAALAAQETDVRFEVIVVLNRCTDSTEAAVRGFHEQLPNLAIVRADERRGPSYARNRGVERARGEIILNCDSDDVVAPGWVDAMTRALANADLVGGRLDPFGAPDGCLLGVGVQRDELPLANDRSRFAVGASLGYRRALAQQVPFVEEIVFGAEDVDFALRAQRQGARVAFAADAGCHYRTRGSWRERRAQMRRYARGDVTIKLRNDPDAEPGILLSLAKLLIVTYRCARARDRCERREYTVMQAWWIARLREHLRRRDEWLALREADAPSGLTRTLGAIGRRFDGRRPARMLARWTTRLELYQPRVAFTIDPLHPTLGGRPATAPLGTAERLAATGGTVGLDPDELHELGVEVLPPWSSRYDSTAT